MYIVIREGFTTYRCDISQEKSGGLISNPPKNASMAYHPTPSPSGCVTSRWTLQGIWDCVQLTSWYFVQLQCKHAFMCDL